MLRHEGKKRGKRSISILLLALVLMCAVSGCGKKNEKKEDTTEKVTTTIESQSESGETGESNFDFSQVFDNIEVNGKHVPFPFSLNDLGDEYEFTSIVDMGDGTFGMTLLWNGKDIGGAYVVAKNEKEIGRNSEIFRVELEDKTEIKINQISTYSTDKEIEDKFTDLPIMYNKYDKKVGYCANNLNDYFEIYGNSDEMKTITIVRGE